MDASAPGIVRQRRLPVLAASLIALASIAAALFIATHHPLMPTAMITTCIVVMAICLRFDNVWLLLLPALLPVVDLAPWTGWLTFEEFDALALSAASGAWLRHAWAPGITAPARPSRLMLGIAVTYLLLLAVTLGRGIADAGGLSFDWFQGYDGPMNSVRLAKSFLLAALFAPLLGRASSRLESRGVIYLGWGMALGLATVSLAAIWERIAFPGLLNFSADYRTTALFWEMHVGGAALDGFLVLTLPFAVLLLTRSTHLMHLLPAAIILALGIYASLTTFSRGVYLAEGVALIVLATLLLMTRKQRRTSSGQQRSPIIQLALGAIAIVAIAALTHLVFRHGGYRAALAFLGCLVVFMPAVDRARSFSRRTWSAAWVMTVLLASGAIAITSLAAKGAYWFYAALFGVALAGWLQAVRGQSDLSRTLALAATLSLPVAAALIANHWGGTPALQDTLAALSVVCVLVAWGFRSPDTIWPSGWRQQAVSFATASAVTAIVAVFSGGAYMEGRFSTSEQDIQGRVQHWQAGLDLLRSPADWLLGKGLGRFPATFFFGAPGVEFPGSHQLIHDAANDFLSISGPRYQAGYGEVLRIGQRVQPGPAGRHTLEFDVRSHGKVHLSLSVCSKHLLYAESCGGKEIAIDGTTPTWQHQTVQFDVPRLGGAWYAPQFTVFSLAIETLGGRADIDNLSLVDPNGRMMLANGDFSHDMARWFFTSDHHHLPWHMKNLFLHVLFEQGFIGLALFLALVAAALYRSMLGRRAHHPLAPAIVAGVVGFLVVGMFDSLLDVPRGAFLFFLLLLLAIQGRKAC